MGSGDIPTNVALNENQLEKPLKQGLFSLVFDGLSHLRKVAVPVSRKLLTFKRLFDKIMNTVNDKNNELTNQLTGGKVTLSR